MTDRNVIIAAVIAMKIRRHVSPIIKLRCKLENWQTARIKTENSRDDRKYFPSVLIRTCAASALRFSAFLPTFYGTVPTWKMQWPKTKRGTKRSSKEEHVSTVRRERGSMVDQSRSKEEHRYSLEKIIPQGCPQEKLLLLGGKKQIALNLISRFREIALAACARYGWNLGW